MVVAALVAAVILVKVDIVGRLTYSIEKARIRALREALPAEGTPPRANDSGRVLAASVLPAVVSISTERIVARSSFEGLDPRFHEFLFRDRGDDVPEQPDSKTPDADANSSGIDLNTTGMEIEPGAAEDEETEDEEAEEPSWDMPNGQGSGFIFDAAQGHILTNGHVVADSDKIFVRLADGRRFEASVLGVDEKTDLAVIKIDADRLHQIPLGDSAVGEVGDEVFAVGNPFGLDGSISRGIISAKNRSNVLLRDVEYQGFLQTDAVINPGNSGGPLVNARGEVIGINTAIATTTGFYDGIGFAIPSNRAMRIIPQLVRGERVTRGYLGVRIGPIASLEEADLEKLGWREPQGVVVFGVLPDSPAAKSGLRENDILVSYEGQPLASTADLTQVVADTDPGVSAKFEVWRDRKLVALKIEIGKQPENFTTRGFGPARPRPLPERE